MEKGIHPTTISEGFTRALKKSLEIITSLHEEVKLSDRQKLIECVNTSLSSKVVAGNKDILSPLAADAVLKVLPNHDTYNVDLRDVRVHKKLGGTIEETQMVDGIVLPDNKPSKSAGGPTSIKNPKIAIL